VSDIDGETPLMHMCQTRVPHDQLTKAVSASKIIDRGDDLGRTALMHAVAALNVDAVRLLVTAGASKDVRNKAGDSAFLIAWGQCPQAAALDRTGHGVLNAEAAWTIIAILAGA
jgi:ankyrin repeat protein